MSDLVILKRVPSGYDVVCVPKNDFLWKAFFPSELELIAALRNLESVWDLEINTIPSAPSEGNPHPITAFLIQSASLAQETLLSAGFSQYIRTSARLV